MVGIAFREAGEDRPPECVQVSCQHAGGCAAACKFREHGVVSTASRIRRKMRERALHVDTYRFSIDASLRRLGMTDRRAADDRIDEPDAVHPQDDAPIAGIESLLVVFEKAQE